MNQKWREMMFVMLGAANLTAGVINLIALCVGVFDVTLTIIGVFNLVMVALCVQRLFQYKRLSEVTAEAAHHSLHRVSDNIILEYDGLGRYHMVGGRHYPEWHPELDLETGYYRAYGTPEQYLYRVLMETPKCCPDCQGRVETWGPNVYCKARTCRSGFLVDPVNKIAVRAANAEVGFYEGEHA